MEGATLRTRLVQLLQRSRRAVRLYSSVGRNYSSSEINEVTETQAREWQNVNTELLRRLAPIAEEHRAKELVRGLFAVRDWFFEELRSLERELWEKQRALCSAAESGDFARSLVLSRSLVSLKAQVQANQAVCHEIDQVIKQSRVNRPDGVDIFSVENSPGNVQVQREDVHLTGQPAGDREHGSGPICRDMVAVTGIVETAEQRSGESECQGSGEQVGGKPNFKTEIDVEFNHRDSTAVEANGSNKETSRLGGQGFFFAGNSSKVIPLKRRR